MQVMRLAVDTNFLLYLAQPREVAHDALEVIRRRIRGAQILVTPTVLDELVTKSEDDTDPVVRDLARKALPRFMREWGMTPVELPDLQSTFARSIADKLLAQGIMPCEEHNDARILAEAALLECQLLVSSDSHLCDIDPGRLALALQACGVSVVLVLSPRDIVRKFAGR